MYFSSLARTLKRAILTQGYASHTFRYIRAIDSLSDRGLHPTDGRYLVNISYDLELAFGTYFWNHDFVSATRVGKEARSNLLPTLSLLNNSKIGFNVQIVGMLLESHINDTQYFNEIERTFMTENSDLFHLLPEEIDALSSQNIELGIHGYSHHLFTDLSEEDARSEIVASLNAFREHEGTLASPTFFAYPRNYTAHVPMLKVHGIPAWRGDEQCPRQNGSMPRGIWFAPGILEPRDLKRLLLHIRKTQPGYLLHLWNHFTEMESTTLSECIRLLKEEGWEFTTIRDFRKEYITSI